MGAAASSTGSVMAVNEHVCFGYWDTSTNSIHMVRLNSTDSTTMSNVSSISSQSSLEEIDDAIPEVAEVEGNEDEEVVPVVEEEKLVPISVNTNNKGRKLSTEIITLPKRFKLRHHGYSRLQCKENVARRLSGVKLQELESVDMPLKAAKILIGNPMRLKMDNREQVDSDEDIDVPVSGHFDIVSLHKKAASKVVLPQLNKDTPLVQSSTQSATVLTSSDTQITMVLPRKAAKILLGEAQVKSSMPLKTSAKSSERPALTRGKMIHATLSLKPTVGSC